MKFFSRFFWGAMLILIGACLLLNHFTGWDIPVGTIIAAFILIYFGIVIMFGKQGFKTAHNSVFSTGKVTSSDSQNQYDVIFGRENIDLSSIILQDSTREVKVDYVFSNGSIIINRDMPVIVKVDSAFSGVRFPNGNSISFGDYTYTTNNFNAGIPHLVIKADAVFSSLEIIEK